MGMKQWIENSLEDISDACIIIIIAFALIVIEGIIFGMIEDKFFPNESSCVEESIVQEVSES